MILQERNQVTNHIINDIFRNYCKVEEEFLSKSEFTSAVNALAKITGGHIVKRPDAESLFYTLDINNDNRISK